MSSLLKQENFNADINGGMYRRSTMSEMFVGATG